MIYTIFWKWVQLPTSWYSVCKYILMIESNVDTQLPKNTWQRLRHHYQNLAQANALLCLVKCHECTLIVHYCKFCQICKQNLCISNLTNSQFCNFGYVNNLEKMHIHITSTFVEEPNKFSSYVLIIIIATTTFSNGSYPSPFHRTLCAKKLKRIMRRHKGAPKRPSPNQWSRLSFNYKSNHHDLLEPMDDSDVINQVIYYIIKTLIFLSDLDWVLPNPTILFCKKKWGTWMWSINLGLHWMAQTHSMDLALSDVVGL
jgi:hypothetical protein